MIHLRHTPQKDRNLPHHEHDKAVIHYSLPFPLFRFPYELYFLAVMPIARLAHRLAVPKLNPPIDEFTPPVNINVVAKVSLHGWLPP